jgi:hypothetical protein
MAPTSSGVPIHCLPFPSSPSQLPPWVLGPTTTATFSSPPPCTTPERQLRPHPAPMGSRGAATPPGVLYGGVDGTLFSSASTAAREDTESSARGAAFEAPPGQATLRFYKLEFLTYDGTVDPLNWLNQCEQFFHGQRTLASDRTWLASYHLTGAAQTWYFAIEQDEGMPHWDRFKELCHLQFGPAVCGSRLAELVRLQFMSTVQDYADRFNAVLCHARNLDAVQKAELFVGGLPDHIRVDVELRAPQDLPTAMHLARAFELPWRHCAHPSSCARRASSVSSRRRPLAPRCHRRRGHQQGAPHRPQPLSFRRCRYDSSAVSRRWNNWSADAGLVLQLRRGFRSRPPVQAVVLPRVGQLHGRRRHPPDHEATEDDTGALLDASANALVVSLHAVAGLQMENSMVIYVTIKGERLLALLDTGSTHNFI